MLLLPYKIWRSKGSTTNQVTVYNSSHWKSWEKAEVLYHSSIDTEIVEIGSRHDRKMNFPVYGVQVYIGGAGPSIIYVVYLRNIITIDLLGVKLHSDNLDCVLQ